MLTPLDLKNSTKCQELLSQMLSGIFQCSDSDIDLPNLHSYLKYGKLLGIPEVEVYQRLIHCYLARGKISLCKEYTE